MSKRKDGCKRNLFALALWLFFGANADSEASNNDVVPTNTVSIPNSKARNLHPKRAKNYVTKTTTLNKTDSETKKEESSITSQRSSRKVRETEDQNTLTETEEERKKRLKDFLNGKTKSYSGFDSGSNKRF
ncbi:MAG: hypothetical protein P4L53_22805 [Candidatus Obscuribacterales bacterium]|nr:hypothetical protein [Candidatus Obscuribacterales bacterium]